MSLGVNIFAAVMLGLIAAHEASATTIEKALANAAWDESTLDLTADSATDVAFTLAGDFYVGEADPILTCGGCEYWSSACYGNYGGCCAVVDCGAGVGHFGPKWYATIGAVFLDRETPTAGTIIAANPALTPFSGAQDYNFDWQGGPEVALARRFANGCIVEARYFSVDNTATAALVTPGSFIGAGYMGPAGTDISGRYLTMLDSTEINARKRVTDRLTLLSGFRYVELRDELQYQVGPTASSNYDYKNRLYGAQVGSNLVLSSEGRRLLANVESKVGIFGNDAQGGIRQFQPLPISSFLGSDTETAFVGEINLTTGFRLTDQLALRGGYQLLWLENVALASDATSRGLTNPSVLVRVADDAGLFYHGATLGIDFVW